MINLKKSADKYFYVYANCFITKGAKRLSIFDINRNKMYFMNADYYELFKIMAKYKISDIISRLDSEHDIIMFNQFINKLVNLELGLLVDDISLFPPIEEKWETPAWITNSIIDIRHIYHNFEKISDELNECRCKYVQIRAYELLDVSKINNIIHSFKNKSFLSVNLLLKYTNDKEYKKELIELIKKDALFHLTLYGAPKECARDDKKNRIKIISNNIHSCNDCGRISKESFVNSPICTIQSFMENKLYNGCLNKKISIDENGEIKNCPSMNKSFGNIRESSIFEISQNEMFKELWNVNNSKIEVCKDCEYRCICTDCRAFIEKPDDIYSKPAKCSYNPYLSKW